MRAAYALALRRLARHAALGLIADRYSKDSLGPSGRSSVYGAARRISLGAVN